MRYTLIVILYLAGINVFFAAGQGIVQGRVFDKQNQEPIPGVYVIYGTNLGTTTDADGNFEFKASEARVNITFRFLGYKIITIDTVPSSSEPIVLSVGLDHELNLIDQIVVSANRREESVSELTVSATIISPLALSKTHITSAQELINKTSGIEVLDGQASIRGGSGFSYGAGSRVLTLIDGLPVLSPDAGNIKWQFLPLENLSQVEVIKGASSVLYGSSALNGIINFRTADATNTPVTHFYAETGVFDKPRQKDWVWWSTPRVFSSASFSFLQKKGNTDIGLGATLISDNGYRRLNEEKLGRINLRLKHFNTKISGLSYGFNINTGYTEKTDFLLWEDADRGALKNAPATSQELHGSFYAVDPFVSYFKPGKFRHDLKMRIQSTGNKFPVNGQNNSDALALFAEYQLWYKVGDKIDITAGVSDYNSKIVSRFYGDHAGMNLAGFAQAEIKPVEKLKISAGLRVEQNFLDGKGDEVTPVFRAGLNYRTTDHTYIRGSFGQGYRFPSIAEKFANTTLGSITIFPDPFVEPESGWSTEAGVKQEIHSEKINGHADFAFFFSENKDMIEYLFGLYPDPVTSIFTYGFKATNIENSQVYGFESEVLLNRSFGEINITGTGSYTFLYPVEITNTSGSNPDKYLKYRRKHSLKADVMAEYRRFDLGFTIYGKSKILNIDDVFLNIMTRESILPGFFDYWNENNKAYFLMDLNLGYNINEHFNLSIAAKNVTNTEYMGRPGDIMPHRNYSVRFSGRF